MFHISLTHNQFSWYENILFLRKYLMEKKKRSIILLIWPLDLNKIKSILLKPDII